MKKISALILILYSSLLYSQSNTKEVPNIIAHRTTEEITLNRTLDESVWKTKPNTGLTQREPEEGKPASQKFEIWIAYDNDYFYFVGKFYDTNPELIDSALMRRDNIVASDWFWIFLDTYNDDINGLGINLNRDIKRNGKNSFTQLKQEITTMKET